MSNFIFPLSHGTWKSPLWPSFFPSRVCGSTKDFFCDDRQMLLPRIPRHGTISKHRWGDCERHSKKEAQAGGDEHLCAGGKKRKTFAEKTEGWRRGDKNEDPGGMTGYLMKVDDMHISQQKPGIKLKLDFLFLKASMRCCWKKVPNMQSWDLASHEMFAFEASKKAAKHSMALSNGATQQLLSVHKKVAFGFWQTNSTWDHHAWIYVPTTLFRGFESPGLFHSVLVLDSFGVSHPQTNQENQAPKRNVISPVSMISMKCHDCRLSNCNAATKSSSL